MESFLTESNKILKLQLEPYYLSNPMDKIKEEIENKYKNKCFRDLGLIKDIKNIIQIGNPIISRNNSFPLFSINVTIISFIPKENEILTININTISEQCIIGNFMEKIIVLVTLESIKLKKFSFIDEKFVRGKKVLKRGTNIEVKITKIKYKNEEQYMCISELI